VARVILNKEQVANLYNSGMDQKSVAKALMVSENTISKFMRKHGLQTRKGAERFTKQINNNY